MKVKNEYVKITTSKKEITLKNLILNRYLQRLLAIQFRKNQLLDIRFSAVMLKFETPIDVTPDSQLTYDNFDLIFNVKTIDSQYAGSNIIVDYQYSVRRDDFDDYWGQKVTGIAFGYDGLIIGSLIDTSNYNIYLTDISDMQIYRRDIYSTDSEVLSSDKLLHLFPKITTERIGNSTGLIGQWGVLKSIGLGLTVSQIIEEYDIEDFGTTFISDYEFEIDKELTIEYASEGLFPELDLYPSNDIYPARIIKDAMYPSYDIYPGLDIYPVEAPYQYVQLKYQVYQYSDFETPNIKALDKYYIVSNRIPNNAEKIKERVKYERA